MNRPIVKICGLTRPQDVETALLYGADFLGFIIEAKSPRRLSVHQATRLSRPATDIAKRVAVSVNADDNLLAQIRDDMAPDFVQYHGDESPKRIQHAVALTDIPAIKAIAVRDTTDIKRAKTYDGIVDYILLDAKAPKNSSQYGGHGLAFDWNLIRNISLNTPIILAGGLSPDNIKTAKKIALASGINKFDIASGVEASAGLKDPSLIAAFMKALLQESRK